MPYEMAFNINEVTTKTNLSDLYHLMLALKASKLIQFQNLLKYIEIIFGRPHTEKAMPMKQKVKKNQEDSFNKSRSKSANGNIIVVMAANSCLLSSLITI